MASTRCWRALTKYWCAGGLAGACSWLSVYPTDVVKSRLQVLRYQLNIPQFLSFPIISYHLLLPAEVCADGCPPPRRCAGHAAISDTFRLVQALCMPQSVVSVTASPQQPRNGLPQATSAGESRYAGWADCAARSYQEEGANVFVRGLGATLARAFLVNAVIFSAYEFCSGALSPG